MKGRGVKAFLLSCVFWLIPGILAGVVTAVCFSFREYDYTVRLTEAALEGRSIPAGLKFAAERGNSPDQGSSRGESAMPESGGGAEKPDQDASAEMQETEKACVKKTADTERKDAVQDEDQLDEV